MKKNLVFGTLLSILLIVLGFGWYYFPQRNHCAIPVHFLDCFDTAYTTVTIEGKEYCLKIDLGQSLAGYLKKEVLSQIKKEFCGTAFWENWKGDKFQSPAYVLRKMKVGKVTFSNLCLFEENEEYNKSAIICLPSEKKKKEEYDRRIDGLLGLGLFLKSKIPALFLDLNHATFFVIKDLHLFCQQKYSLHNMVKIPLERKYNCLALQVETDLGTKRFLLDSGATRNWIRDSLFPPQDLPQEEGAELLFSSRKFVIGGRNFGKEEFCVKKMLPAYEDIDGVLGMKFFRKYVILFDLIHDFAYVDLSQNKNLKKLD